MLRQGKLDESLAALNEALELAPKDAGALQLRADALRLQPLLAKLDEYVAGTEKPADNAQRLELAGLCFFRQRFVAAAKFFAAALAEDPKLADDPAQGNRYNAACAAVRAGNGEGDAKTLDPSERAELRKQAAAWLTDELDNFSKLLAAGTPQDRQRLLPLLKNWRYDADLASLRNPESLDNLPEHERSVLRTLWSNVDTALKDMP